MCYKRLVHANLNAMLIDLTSLMTISTLTAKVLSEDVKMSVSSPEKKLATSSCVQDQGSPLIRTTYPSSFKDILTVTDYTTQQKDICVSNTYLVMNS